MVPLHTKSWFVDLIAAVLATFVLAVHASPIGTTESLLLSVAEDRSRSPVPDEFPDDYSISLEQAVVDRKEFAEAALLQMLTAMMEEILEEKKGRREMMEAIHDLQRRVAVQEKMVDSLDRRNNRLVEVESVGRLEPSSCQDWKLAGHTREGFYPIRGKQTMEAVYCSFSKSKDDN